MASQFIAVQDGLHASPWSIVDGRSSPRAGEHIVVGAAKCRLCGAQLARPNERNAGVAG